MTATVTIPANPAIAAEVSAWLDEHGSWVANEWEVNLIELDWHVTFKDESLATAFLLRWA